MLKDEKGNIKPFSRFRQEITSLYQTYNVRYLEAEYNFAAASAQMAAKWSDFEQDGDQYNLQFRTSNDEKVRASHAALHNTTLPPSDPFWDNYIPPLDWNCRCTVVQVLKNKYPLTNSAQAIRNGEAATTRIDKNGVNRAAMFRFNPGKQKVIFPQNHPYFKVQQRVKDVIDSLLTSYSEKAKAAKGLVSWYKQNLPTTKIGKFDARRFEVKAAMLDQPVVVNANFYNELIYKYRNDKRYILKLEIAKKAHELIGVADFVSQEDARHGNNRFNVYTTSHNGLLVIMKVKITKDGNFLHHLVIK
ncbi:MAG: minor capsid protein [Bacteroidetes bacterium]|nr:minor capsid protein [Bacteroidota bacterium]